MSLDKHQLASPTARHVVQRAARAAAAFQAVVAASTRCNACTRAAIELRALPAPGLLYHPAVHGLRAKNLKLRGGP